MKSTDLKTGMAVRIDGQLFIITFFQHVTPGNLRAFVQVKLKNIATGQTIEKRLRSGEDIERIDLDRREIEYLYSDGSGAVFMDNDSYEQFNIAGDVLGDALLYVKPNGTLTALMHEENVVSVELPGSVVLRVVDTPPGIKGATATNQLKEAELETGLKTRVPPFITNDELIRVNTDTGEYLGRASE